LIFLKKIKNLPVAHRPDYPQNMGWCATGNLKRKRWGNNKNMPKKKRKLKQWRSDEMMMTRNRCALRLFPPCSKHFEAPRTK
jgi:hypothetical protein